MTITFNNLKKAIQKDEIDTVLVCVSDMQGRLNGKRVTGKAFLDYVHKETHMCDYLYTVDMDMFTVPGYKSSSWETGYGDMTVIPDLKTIKIATWLEKTAIVICDCLDHHGKKPLIHSTRQILKDVIAKANKMGFDPMIGSELEFFLFNQTYEEIHNNNYTNFKEASWYIEDYMIFQTTKEEDVMRELRNSLLKSGIYVECSKGEAAPGQEEINVVFTDALNMADNHILIKNAAKEIAFKHNKAVTFMAKYNKEVCGSSCHIHNSLFDKKTKKNVFNNPKDKYGMSDIFKSYVAGQIKFLSECYRVAKNRVFIVTPNRFFPIELHTYIPLLHFLPKTFYRFILKIFGNTFFSKVENLNLLSEKDLRNLCKLVKINNYNIVRHKLFGFTSNLILIIKKN